MRLNGQPDSGTQSRTSKSIGSIEWNTRVRAAALPGSSDGKDGRRGNPLPSAQDGIPAGRYVRVLSANDRVYLGRDNRYYCRRSDGTTGLIIGGAEDGPDFPEVAKKAAEAFPNAELVLIPNVGHNPHLEAPEKVVPPLVASTFSTTRSTPAPEVADTPRRVHSFAGQSTPALTTLFTFAADRSWYCALSRSVWSLLGRTYTDR